MSGKLLETDLYPPLEHFLKRKGYVVHAEVILSDISAVKGDELLIIEIKMRFNLDVILQAIRRQAAADSVYIAVPVFDFKKYPRRWKDIRGLCLRLGIGVLFVRFIDEGEPTVEVGLPRHAQETTKSNKKKSGFLREIHDRRMNLNIGGSTGKPIFTAYRLEALKISDLLEKNGPLSPKKLRDLGRSSKTGNILRDNHYGWFERVEKGLYALTEAGTEAVRKHRKTLAEILPEDVPPGP